MQINRPLRYLLPILLAVTPMLANALPLKCASPVPWFSYEFLDRLMLVDGLSDAVVNEVMKSPPERSARQVALWYVFRKAANPSDVWRGVNPSDFFESAEEPEKAIMYILMFGKKDLFGFVPEEPRRSLRRSMLAWKATLLREDETRSLLLDVFTIGYARSAARKPLKFQEDNSFLWARANLEIEVGDMKSAFRDFSMLAERGSMLGLVNSALYMPQVLGDQCFARARLFMSLSGLNAPVTWTRLPGAAKDAPMFQNASPLRDSQGTY